MSSKYCILALIVAALAAAPVSAGFINVTTETLLFYDNYDTQPADNVSHVGYKDDTTVGKPLSQDVGSYSYSAASNNRTIQVTDHAGANSGSYSVFIDPGPYKPAGTVNTNYLRFYRGADSQPILYQVLESLQSTAGQTIHWEQMICIEGNGTSGNMQFFFQNAVPATKTLLGIDTLAGGVIKPYTGATWGAALADISWTQGAWQKWEVDYTIGADTYTLTIDGTEKTGVPVNDKTAGILTVAYTQFPHGSYTVGPICLDEVPVPEPSIMVLLASGLFGLLAYAWRKRK